MPGTPKWVALRRYLVAGVLVWLPILATIWVVSFMLHIMDRTLLWLPPSWRPQALVGFALPGAGLVLAFVVVLLTGLLVTNLIGRRLIVWGEDLLNRIPVVRTVYGGVKSSPRACCPSPTHSAPWSCSSIRARGYGASGS